MATAPAVTTPPYVPSPSVFDEALEGDGSLRPHYAALLGALGRMDLAVLSRSLRHDGWVHGVSFGGAGDTIEPFRLDPVPRLITAAEWELLERGLVQRVRGLDRFVADAYGAREIVEAGVVPARVVESCDHWEPRLAYISQPPVRVVVAGLDVVRDEKGRFLVLEDNLRTPSGSAYVLAAREALDRSLPPGLVDAREPLDTALAMLGDALSACTPEGVDEPSIVLLTDGPVNSAWYEHRRIAAALRLPLVTLADLESGPRLHARVGRRRIPVDVVYRRTDEDRLADEGGGLTAVGEALIEPLVAGTLTCANAFGTGVADDKLAHAYVEQMIRFYLSEEPLLRSVPSYDLGDDRAREAALERIDELVVKPRSGYGGHGVVVAPHAHAKDVRGVAEAVREDPERYIAQETVTLSQHPTVNDGRLEPRHVDLRPFVFLSPENACVLPGGLSRVALERGALVVNSSQQGGGKDTWVLR